MDKYLIAIDLDGTILPGLYDLSDYNIRVFNALKKQGHKIVITTGRPFRSSFFVYHKFNLDTPLINYNGGLITNPRDVNYKVHSDMMDKNEILDIYNHEKDNYDLFFIEAFDNIYSNISNDFVLELMHHNILSNLYVGDLNKIMESGAHGSLILAKKGKGKLIDEYVKNNHKNIGSRMWSWGPYEEIVELFSYNSSKGKALESVRQNLCFDEKHTIICGDSINDFEFFSVGGIKICPNNAVEEIKALADIVLDENCEDDAIASYFNKYFNLGVEKRK